MVKPGLEDILSNPGLAEAILGELPREIFVADDSGAITAAVLKEGGETYLGRRVSDALLERYGVGEHDGDTLASLPGCGTRKEQVETKDGRLLEVRIGELIQTGSGRRRIITVDDETAKFLDALTGLKNQNYWTFFAETAYQIGVRGKGVVHVAVLDVDNFNEVNNAYGHLNGDLVLTKIGEMLRTYFKRQSDILARIGGDEFGIVIINGTDKTVKRLEEFAAEAYSAISRLLGMTACESGLEGNAVYCGISYGLAASGEKGSTQPAMSFNEAFKTADLQLYQMKKDKVGCKARKENPK